MRDSFRSALRKYAETIKAICRAPRYDEALWREQYRALGFVHGYLAAEVDLDIDKYVKHDHLWNRWFDLCQKLLDRK